MDVHEEPQTKRRRSLDIAHCVICSDLLQGSNQGPAVKNPTVEGLRSVLNAAELRQDDIYQQIWPHREDILTLQFKVSYHKSCRAQYTSKTNVSRQTEKSESPAPSASSSQPRRLTREDTSSFNIREQCFICGSSEKRKPDKSREKLTPISTDTGKSTRSKVIEAAEKRQDEVIRLRMLCHPDLFAFDGKYHRSCYSHYISDRNVQASVNTMQEQPLSTHDKAFHKLAHEIEQTVLSKKTPRVSTLASERHNFISIKIEMGIPQQEAQQYSTWKLKQRLKGYFQGKLSFIERSGYSDLLCSSSITVGDALNKAANLHAELSDQDEPDLAELSNTPSMPMEMDEALVLHRAAGILRKSMADITDSPDTYISAAKIEVGHCRSEVPDALYDFIVWSTSARDYQNVTTTNEADVPDLRVLAICHNIIALCQKVKTALTLGLALQVHHDFGNMHLVDVLHNLGHCVSYDEVRRFTTSVAKDQISQAGDVYVPRGIQSVDLANADTFVDAAIDNFDQNEETLDGKTTTHSMAAVLYQRCGTLNDDETIPRTRKKALDVTEYTEEPLHRYAKPQQRPEPPPMPDASLLEVDKAVIAKGRDKDLVWELARFASKGTHTIPAWSGFNAMTSDKTVPVATIRYLPFIHAPPTDLSTIYTTLLKLVAVAEKLGQPHILVTGDLAIYLKAQQILWSKPESLAGKVTMRLGGMHLLMAFIASIGKLFGDGGLLQLLTATDVYADATARQMLQGKQLNRAVRGIKLVLEALSHVYLTSAQSWCHCQGIQWMALDTYDGITDLQHTYRAKDKDSSRQIIDNLDTSGVTEALRQFQAMGRSQSATFKFWDNFMDSAHIMLRLLRAERDADFDLHLDAVCETIPYFICGGRNNYAKYTPVYVAEMRQLETQQPDAYKQLQSGAFVVRRSPKRQFNCVPTDQALEQTVNREAKSHGGIIGFTLRKGALLRWLITRHVTGSYAEAMKMMCTTASRPDIHEELGSSRMKRDASDVGKIIDALVGEYQNPFDLETVPTSLINIVTGQVATQEVEDSLTGMQETGKAHMKNFLEKRLVENTKSVSFWDPQPRLTIKTFADMRKPLPTDKQKKLMCSTEVLFRRLLSVSKTRDIDLQKVLEHELAAVPPALFNDDGTMRKTNKSDLAKKLESVCAEVPTLPKVLNQPDNTGYVIDGMAMLQSLNESYFKTFDDLSQQVLKKILRLLEQEDLGIDVVTVVFDRYDKDDSIKQMERRRRGAGETTPSHQITGLREVPNYRLFLKGSANKAALSAFVCESIAASAPAQLKPNNTIIFAGGFASGETVKLVTNSGVVMMPHLFSTQEEADTRLVLHVIDLATTHTRVIVRCDDTDVLVLLLYYYDRGLLADEVYMHAGHAGKIVTRERYIPIHTIAGELGNRVSACLPAAHALTGCDTTSAFFKIGKITAFTKLVEHIDSVQQLSEFGGSSSLSISLDTARRYVLLLYGKRSKNCNTLDELRYALASTTDKQAAMLPPTEDAFKQHVMRALFQAMIWLQSHVAKPEVKDPVGHGWARGGDGSLEHKLYEKQCAPLEVRDITHLVCNDKYCKVSGKCPCLQAGLPCIESCACSSTDCPNSSTAQQGESDDEVIDNED